MKEKLKIAEEGVAQLKKQLKDRFYPEYHIAPEAGWMNDPNGLIYFNKKYHVFFQHHPFGTEWGPMHWAHLTSDDLVSWERQPIALAPTVGPDADGCFSGSAVINENDELVLLYTGHKWLKGFKNDDAVQQVQCIATSKDGINFEKKGTIIIPPKGIMHFRDPKVWKENKTWYMVVGVKPLDNIGEIWLYSSDNLKNWKFERVLYKAKNSEIFMLECPDFFKLGNKWVLMFCPQGLKAEDYDYRNIYQSGYVIGNWSPNTDFVVEKEFQEFDFGHDFYAPQTFVTPDGRRLLLGWNDSPDAIITSQQDDGWSCQQTLFRELSLLNNNRVKAAPFKEVQKLRKDEINIGDKELSSSSEMLDIDTNACEIKLKFDVKNSSSSRYGIAVAATIEHEETLIFIDRQSNRLVLDRKYSGLGGKGYRSVPISIDQDVIELNIFVDKSSVEVYVNDGEYCLSSIIFPSSTQRKMKLFAEEGMAKIQDIKVWYLKNIYK